MSESTIANQSLLQGLSREEATERFKKYEHIALILPEAHLRVVFGIFLIALGLHYLLGGRFNKNILQ